jgi:hypothetical protein
MKLTDVIDYEQLKVNEAVTGFAAAMYLDGIVYESDELFEGAVSKFLEKLGLTVHKTKGLVDYVAGFTKGLGQIIIAAAKGDKERVKQIEHSVKKEDVIDFLLKLDMATLHLVSGPIHFIDAITGWDLWANVKSTAQKGKSVLDMIKKEIDTVVTMVKTYIYDPRKETMVKTLNDLRKTLGDTI